MENKINQILNETINDYTDSYLKILKNFNPSIGSHGFEERNQTNNFVNSLIKSTADNEAFAWFETSLEGHQKIDATVFSPQNQSVFFIEAKRITNGKVETKIDEIIKDFKRLQDKHEIIINNKWKSEIKINNKYIVYLADVWKEKDKTINIANNWKEKGLNIIENDLNLDQSK